MSFKIAIIGAGSVGFTRKLFTDILCVPEFADIEVALTDISQHNLDMIETILKRTVAANRLPTKITATTDRRKAIDGRPLCHQLRARRRACRLCRRHPHSPEVRRRPVRRRHHLRRRHLVWPAQHPRHPRLLQRHPRTGRAGRQIPQLRQPDGDEHLGGDRVRQGRHDRPLPRRPAWRRPDRRSARRAKVRARLCLLRHQSPDLVHRRARARQEDRQGRARRGIRGASGLFQAGEAQDRRAEALWRLFDREQRPSVGIPAVVSQAAGRARPVDRHVQLDPRRNRRLSPSFHRNPQLVRGGISKTARGGRQADRSRQPLQRACQPHIGSAGDRPRLSRPLQRQERWRHHQPAARRHHRIAWLRRPLRHQHGCRASRCRKPAPPPACRRSTSSACRSMPPFRATSTS